MAWFVLVTFVATIATLFYAFVKYKYSYWNRKGFKTYPGLNYFAGHFGPVFSQKKHMTEYTGEIYRNTNEPYVGIYGILRPMLVVRDPELIRKILVKDFAHFPDRGTYCDEKRDPLSGHLFSLGGEKWANLRAKLTPAFTSGKLKAMFSSLVNCDEAVQNYLEKAVNDGRMVEIRDLASNITVNIITSVAFGIDSNSINNPKSEFRECGRKVFASSIRNGIRLGLMFLAPNLMKFMPFKSVDKDIEEFIYSVVRQNLKLREENHVVRKDFFQLLVQLRNKGTVQLDDQWETEIKLNEKKLSLDEIAAQTLIFFLAGYETSSQTISFCVYHLAKNPEIQKKVHDDIDRVLKKYKGEITYESMSEMTYLECCIDETLRMYAAAPLLIRKCVKDYPIPGTDKIIEKGVEVHISLQGLHSDERFYSEPEKFIPERFNAENSAGKNQINRPYLPFGDGSRHCIGMRLGKMQVKVVLMLLLRDFQYELEPDQRKKRITFDPRHLTLSANERIMYRVTKRQANFN